MREVTQFILAGDPSGIPGDCVRAAVASLLDMDPAKVPHFTCQDDVRVWHYALIGFAHEHGWRIDRRAVEENDPLPEFGLAIGQSPRGISHAVVAVGGKVAWDPHPSRGGLVDVRQVVEFVRNEPTSEPEDDRPEGCERCGGSVCSECGECPAQGCWDCCCDRRYRDEDPGDSDDWEED